MTTEKKRYWLLGAAVLLLLGSAFFVGLGLGTVTENLKLRRTYQNSSVTWKQELAGGAEEAQVRDLRNQELAKTMQYISINRELYFADGSALAEAQIAVDSQSKFSCMVSIIRDGTGEQLYQSGLIESGHYIETIRLNSSLRKGYYPSTVVWSFYTAEDEYVGETAWKTVVVIAN